MDASVFAQTRVNKYLQGYISLAQKLGQNKLFL
jgi:hypothetical protein